MPLQGRKRKFSKAHKVDNLVYGSPQIRTRAVTACSAAAVFATWHSVKLKTFELLNNQFMGLVVAWLVEA